LAISNWQAWAVRAFIILVAEEIRQLGYNKLKTENVKLKTKKRVQYPIISITLNKKICLRIISRLRGET